MYEKVVYFLVFVPSFLHFMVFVPYIFVHFCTVPSPKVFFYNFRLYLLATVLPPIKAQWIWWILTLFFDFLHIEVDVQKVEFGQNNNNAMLIVVFDFLVCFFFEKLTFRDKLKKMTLFYIKNINSKWP
jgi:hypothetical protein